jgi:hypothetical protein
MNIGGDIFLFILRLEYRLLERRHRITVRKIILGTTEDKKVCPFLSAFRDEDKSSHKLGTASLNYPPVQPVNDFSSLHSSSLFV